MAKKTIKKTVRKAPTKKVGAKKSTKKAASKKSATKKTVSKKSVKSSNSRPKVKAKPSKKSSSSLAIVGLLINILIIPGLGTLIGGGSSRRKSGTIQLILALISWLLIFTVIGMIIGLPLLLAVWIWSVVDMAKAL